MNLGRCPSLSAEFVLSCDKTTGVARLLSCCFESGLAADCRRIFGFERVCKVAPRRNAAAPGVGSFVYTCCAAAIAVGGVCCLVAVGWGVGSRMRKWWNTSNFWLVKLWRDAPPNITTWGKIWRTVVLLGFWVLLGIMIYFFGMPEGDYR